MNEILHNLLFFIFFQADQSDLMDMVLEKDSKIGELENRAPCLYVCLCNLQRFKNSSTAFCCLRSADWRMESLGFFSRVLHVLLMIVAYAISIFVFFIQFAWFYQILYSGCSPDPTLCETPLCQNEEQNLGPVAKQAGE